MSVALIIYTYVQTQKLLGPIEDFGGVMFTAINSTTAVQAHFLCVFNAFSWAENTARGVRFILGFNMCEVPVFGSM